MSRVRAAALAGLGHSEFRRGNPRAAIERFENALVLFGTDESRHPDLADNLGRAHAMIGELESAIGLFERCREAAERRGDTLLELQFAVLLAQVLIDSGNLSRAEELLGTALALGKGSEKPSVRAQLFWSQSRLQRERGDPEAAAH